MCFVWIWEQIEIFSIHSIDWFFLWTRFSSLQPSGHYMYHQFNIQHFHILHTAYLWVLCGYENKQRLFLYTALTGSFLWMKFNPLQPSSQYHYHQFYPLQPSSQYHYHQFNIHKNYILPTRCIYVPWMDLRTNSHYFLIENELTGFYNRDLTL